MKWVAMMFCSWRQLSPGNTRCLVCFSLLELPHKTPLYVKLIALINKREHALGAQLVEILHKRLEMAAREGGPWRHLQQGMQAIAMLAADGIVSGAEVVFESVSISDYGRSLLFNPQVTFKWKGDCEAIDGKSSKSHPIAPLSTLVPDPQWEPAATLLNETELFKCDKESGELIVCHLRQLIETFDLNPRRLVEMLFAACDEELCHPERVIWELLLTEMLRSQKGLRQVCYEVIAMNCCRYRSRTFPPAMAKRLNTLLSDDGEIQAVAPVGLTRLAEWFAHHLSNFDFKWKWEDWQPWLETVSEELSASLLRRLFLVLLIDRLARLSYGERLREVLPGWLHTLLPDSTPDPMPSKSSHEQFTRLVELFGQRAPVDQLMPLLSDLDPGLFIEALVAVSKTLSHCQLLLEQYLTCLQTLNPRDREDCRMATLDAVSQVWQRSPWHRDWLIGRLLHYRVINATQTVRWWLTKLIVDQPLLEQLQCWRLLAATLEQSRILPIHLAHRLERMEEGPAREKLTQTKENMAREYENVLQEAVEGLTALATPFSAAFVAAIRQDH